MNVPGIDLSADPAELVRLSRILEEGWARGRERGAIAYDPGDIEPFVSGAFRYHFLPGRESRPRSLAANAKGGLRRPHAPCPFDPPEFLIEREVARASGTAGAYHLSLNKFPVVPLHYLAIRPATDPPATLPQRIVGAGELEDMLRLAALLGPPWRLFFNSNAGADGSRSGSSVNHWHFQLFPDAWSVAARAPAVEREAGGVETGRIPDWSAHHRLYRSRDAAALARALWGDLEAIDREDIAYNIEVFPPADGRLVVLLFPRAPVPDLHLPWGDVIRGDFGGFELTGSVVVPTARAFDWVRAHPDEAAALMVERMRDGTTARLFRY
jgi:hypothetical protein